MRIINRCRIVNYIIILFLAILTVSGCGAPKITMHNNEIGASKQATIKAEKREYARGQITIATVDGKETVGFLSRLVNGGFYAGEVYVLPGKHRIVAKIDYPYPNSSYAWGHLWLVADPGETYIVKAMTEGYGVRMWLESSHTGQKVGGIAGNDDEPK